MALTELLAAETALVEQFVDALTAEQEALKQGKVDGLPAISTRKGEIIERLNAAEKTRNAALQQAGLSGDREGMQAWLAKNRHDRAAAQAWAKLMKQAAAARELNDLNGQLIAMRLQATSQALAILTQQAQRSALYGPSGHTTQLTGSRIIDAA